MSMNGKIGKIRIAESDSEIRRCYPVMAELRKNIGPADFVERVRRQKELYGFEIVYAEDEQDVKAVAGIRIGEWLAGGKYLEIEDLVTARDARSNGYGGELFDWIVDFAKSKECAELRLVSSVCRFGAHRFYLRKKMNIEAHYFSIQL